MNGIGASQGIGIGFAVLLEEIEIENRLKKIDIDEEKNLLTKSINLGLSQLQNIYEEKAKESDSDDNEIFKAHINMINDPDLKSKILSNIESKEIAAEVATKEVVDEFVAIFESMDNQYFKERALDIKDIGNRIIRNILGIEEVELLPLLKILMP